VRTSNRELLAVGLFGRPSRLGERIELLLKRGREVSPRASASRLGISALVLLALIVAGSGAPRWIAFAQARPAFEVASIRAVKPGEHAEPSLDVSPGHLTIRRYNLRSLVEWAYRVDGREIVGSNGFDVQDFDAQDFDISAKAAGPASADELRLMLQTLLAERFRLAFHREQKLLPLYSLVVDKDGPKMHQVQEEPRQGGRLGWRDNVFTYQMVSHISQLTTMLADFLDDRPVRDNTGLTGVYEITLSVEMDPEQIKRMPQPGTVFTGFGYASGVFDAVERLGLKLVATKGPVEILVIDHVEKPGEN
jgi:uncharacterized protein (TIGR03435 family)